MSRTRSALGGLESFVNVHGEESLRRRVGPERTNVERQSMRMYERREETWRRLNRDRVAAFVELFLLSMVCVENAHRRGRQHPITRKMLNKTLVRRIIPWICLNRIWTMDESQWPMTMEHFRELDHHLANHLTNIHAGLRWQNIVYYYGEIKKEQDRWRWLDAMEKEVMESVRRCLEFSTFILSGHVFKNTL